MYAAKVTINFLRNKHAALDSIGLPESDGYEYKDIQSDLDVSSKNSGL